MQQLTEKNWKQTLVETSPGQLKQVKRLLFLPWTPPEGRTATADIGAVRKSVAAFVEQAIRYAIDGKFTSIGKDRSHL
jgi:hypothetical protein